MPVVHVTHFGLGGVHWPVLGVGLCAGVCKCSQVKHGVELNFPSLLLTATAQPLTICHAHVHASHRINRW